MATSVWRAPDSIRPNGPLIRPTDVDVEYAGPSGDAVWRDHGKVIQTTLAEMRQHTDTNSTFGRDPIVTRDNEKFFNTNDVQRASIKFGVEAPRAGNQNVDLDGDGKDADTFYFRFSDLADVDVLGPNPGVDLWFNGVRVHIDPQANGETDVFAVRTDADAITFEWDSGTDARPDGFAMAIPCLDLV